MIRDGHLPFRFIRMVMFHIFEIDHAAPTAQVLLSCLVCLAPTVGQRAGHCAALTSVALIICCSYSRMDQNAFKALFKTPNETARRLSDRRPKPAKRQRLPPATKPPQKHDVNSGSRFAECPLCGKSIHTLLINGHVERCISAAMPAVDDTSEQLSGYQHGETQQYSSSSFGDGYADIDADPGAGVHADAHASAKVKKDAVITTTARASPSPQSSSSPSSSPNHIECQQNTTEAGAQVPVDQPASVHESRPFPPTSTAADVVVSNMVKSTENKQTCDCSPNGGEIQLLQASVHTEGQNRAAHADNNNLFARLMTASALSDFREEMYLWRHEDETFSWGWGVAGRACPAPPSVVTNERRYVHARFTHPHHFLALCRLNFPGFTMSF